MTFHLPTSISESLVDCKDARLTSFETELLDDATTLVALDLAFRHGLIGKLEITARDPGSADATRLELGFVTTVLSGAGALQKTASGACKLTPIMCDLLSERGQSLAARAYFGVLALRDLVNFGDALVSNEPEFRARAQTFSFFRYDRAQSTKAANVQDTEPWVQYVTALSELEALSLVPMIPLDGCTNLLEIGGNSGAFAMGLVREWPELSVSILDLPAVCYLGEKYLSDKDHRARISFVPGDAETTQWPECDAILFKSMLHDWRAERAVLFLQRAAQHLPAGGRLIVCERGPIEHERDLKGAIAATNLVFAPFYRNPEFYKTEMRKLGLIIEAQGDEPGTSKMDMEFHVICGLKP
ncbi:methyltransferase [Shimia sp.]|uniref:methyltransferase n=1 Tax=Shimia sp. TaxID=1954381 RepID=UPI00329938CB